MGFGSFFKLPQYNVFDYKPRFYDPDKERRREMLNDMRKAQGKDAYGEENNSSKPGANIKGSFRPKMPRKAYSKRNSSIRIIAIAVTLAFVAYLVFVADFAPLVKLFAK
jgi:hypothetical protein